MPGHQLIQRLTQQIRPQSLVRLQQRRLVKMIVGRLERLEKPVLDRREGNLTCDHLGVFLGSLHHDERRRQIGEAGAGEHLAQRQSIALRPQACRHLDRLDRVAAGIEIMRIGIDGRATQHLGPDGGQRLFLRLVKYLTARRSSRLGLHRLRRRQSLAVDLAARVKRQCVEKHEAARHHVIRQPLEEAGAQRLFRGLTRAHHVGDELVRAARGARHHHRLLDRRLGPQP